VLAGRPNAGKSSLFNVLAGESFALVSPEPGTTRDYLKRRLDLGDVWVELIDTAGRQAPQGTLDEQAQSLGRSQAEQADLILLCLEAGQTLSDQEEELLHRPRPPAALLIATKCDLNHQALGEVKTSAATGAGLERLRTLLAERIRQQSPAALAPSLSRCRHHVRACLEHLEQAQQMAVTGEPPELLALQLRGALDELGALVGAIYTDDLLDRIFTRFCIGK
jgi:tRNA modification GTPase